MISQGQGETMARLQCFALTCLLAAVLPAMASAQNCGLREFASIDLLSNEDGMPIVEMQIGGRTVHLLVDTGGVYSSINSDVADALRVSQHDIANGMEVYGAGGERYKTYIEAPDFKLGAIALDKFPMMVAHHALTGAGVDGTLAPDFLSRFEVDFDFGAHKLNFFAPDHCPGKVVYWSKAYVEIPFKIDAITHVAVPMTLDGHQTVATIDTGANLTTLSDAMARSVFGLSETSPGMEAIPSAKPDDLFQYRYRFKTLSLDGLAVNNPLVYILPDAAEKAFRHNHDAKMDIDAIYGQHLSGPELVLGTNVLSKLHLFISYKEKVLYLTAADAHQ
jgi:predicted aspartyl protease